MGRGKQPPEQMTDNPVFDMEGPAPSPKERKRRLSVEGATFDTEDGTAADVNTPMMATFDTEDGGGGATADLNTPMMAFEDEGDEREREWGEKQTGKALVEGDVDAFILWWCQNACASTWLDSVVLAAIILNTIMLAIENPANLLSRDTLAVMVVIDLVLTVGFSFEMFVRIIAMGFWDRVGTGEPPNISYDPCYLNDDWNKLDFFVVLTSWINVLVDFTGIELPFSMSTLRSLRILRVLKAFKKIEGIRQILGTIGQALPHSGNVIAFLGFLLTISGIIGVQMFRGLTRNRCEYTAMDLQAHLDPDKFPLTGVSEGNSQWSGDAWSGVNVTLDGSTVLGDSSPWPQPPVLTGDLHYEYPIGIGVWTTYCTTDFDCPLYEVEGQWSRTQTCQPSLNPGRNFQNYDDILSAWVALFINMANLYWWETAHRYTDANNGMGSDIAWYFGIFNVFFLTYVTVNMFVAVITTVFMDVRSSNTPAAGMGGARETLEEKQARQAAQLKEKRDAWTKPCYHVSACGGDGPFVEPYKEDPKERVGLIWHPLFEQFILAFIFINTFALAADHHDHAACDDPSTPIIEMQADELCQAQWFIDANIYANYVFNFVFTTECVLKITGMGFREYIRLAFNQLDFFIVVTSALDMIGEATSDAGEGSSFSVFKQFRVFRLFRVLRVARILYRNENLKRVLVTVFGSGEAIANLIMFIMFSTLLFAIMGMHLTGGLYHPDNNPDSGYGDNSGSLFGRLVGDGEYDVRSAVGEVRYGYNISDFIRKGLIPRRNFEDFPRAFLLSFQIMTGDDWVNQMHDVMEVKGGSIPIILFFANFSFCNFILLSLFIAVILENFEVAEAEKAELQKQKFEQDQVAEQTAAEKPKISFVHRLVWLFGGEGGRPQCGCGMADDVELDTEGVYSEMDADGKPTDTGTLMPGDKWYNDDVSLYVFPPDHSFRKQMRTLAENPIFDLTILIAILIGTVMLAIEGPPGSMVDRCLATDQMACENVMASDDWIVTLPQNRSFANASVDHNTQKCVGAGTCSYTVELEIGRQRCTATDQPACKASTIEDAPRSEKVQACEAAGKCEFGTIVFIFEWVQLALFCLFMVEFVSKVVAYGFAFTPKSYLKNGWNKLDFVVIVGSILNYIPGVDAGFVKLLRCLRPLRIINRNEGMKVIISAVINSLAVNVGVLALSGLGLLIFAILGVGMFAGQFYTCNCAFAYPQGVTPFNSEFDANGGWTMIDSNTTFAGPPITVESQQHCVGNDTKGLSGGIYGVDPSYPDTISQCYWDNRPYNFDTSINAAMALFSASTLAGWTDIMEIGLDSRGIGMQPVPFSGVWYLKVLYFLFYVIVMSFFVTNLFVGVLIDFIGNSDGSALLTESQQANQDLQKFKKLHRPSKREVAPENYLRMWMYNLVESKFWDLVSNSFIIFNVVVMMCEYEDQTDAWWNTLEFLNQFCLNFFTVEMMFKLIAYFPAKYWKEPWNKFDAIVIALSWGAIIFELTGAQAIRAMRALRIVLVLKSAKGIRSLFQTLILSIAPGTNITVLMLLLYSLYAMIGMMLFGNMPVQDVDCTAETEIDLQPEYCQWEDPAQTNLTTWYSGIAKGKPGMVLLGLNRQYTHHQNFRSFGSAMRLLFQCAAGQDWKFVMYAVGGEPGQPKGQPGTTFVFFLTFLFFSNYILLNLFVAVILDNFSTSMREQELAISEADFEHFKYTFREYTLDAHPEQLPYRSIWRLMASIGVSAAHDDDGNAIESNMCPRPFIDWSKNYDISWKLSKGSNADDKCPSDLKKFLLALYEQDNSPLHDPSQRVGITFNSFYEALMATPAVFEGTDVDTVGPWKLTSGERPGESAPREASPESIEWEAYRISNDPASSSRRESLTLLNVNEVSFEAILWAIKTLRFRIHFYKLTKEISFHGHLYVDDSSAVTYNDLLQALVNMTMGTESLDLEEQMQREAAEMEGDGDVRFREANWLKILNVQRERLLKEVEGAKLNSNTTDAQLAQLQKDLASVEDALSEMEQDATTTIVSDLESQASESGGDMELAQGEDYAR